VTEYGHDSWSRNRCWAYNIPNRSSFRVLQIRLVEPSQRNFFSQNWLVFIRFGGKKIEKLCLNTAITLDPEIVAGPIIYKMEALFKLYKLGRANHANAIFSAKIHLFSSGLEEKNWKTGTDYGHNSWSRNRCWAYNIPNRSSFWALKIRQGEPGQRYIFGQNSLVFIRFGGKKIKKLRLNTAITLDPEIVAGPIINQIEALFELYKLGGANPTSAIFSAKIHLFSSYLEEKKLKNSDWIRP